MLIWAEGYYRVCCTGRAVRACACPALDFVPCAALLLGCSVG